MAIVLRFAHEGRLFIFIRNINISKMSHFEGGRGENNSKTT